VLRVAPQMKSCPRNSECNSALVVQELALYVPSFTIRRTGNHFDMSLRYRMSVALPPNHIWGSLKSWKQTSAPMRWIRWHCDTKSTLRSEIGSKELRIITTAIKNIDEIRNYLKNLAPFPQQLRRIKHSGHAHMDALLCWSDWKSFVLSPFLFFGATFWEVNSERTKHGQMLGRDTSFENVLCADMDY
jgi:hypothetical protein